MAPRTRLAQYLTDALVARGETAEQFGKRVGLNSSGLYKLLRGEYSAPRQDTIEKIAAGLNMSAGELLASVEAQDADDPFEAQVLARTAQFRDILRDVPQVFWATILKVTLDRAVETARDMAQLLAAAEDRAPEGSSDEARDWTSSETPARRQRPIKPREPAFA